MKHSSRISKLRFFLTSILLTGLAWSVTVTISPKRSAVVVSTQTQQFTCSVANVIWSVDGVAGGSASVGTISLASIGLSPCSEMRLRACSTIAVDFTRNALVRRGRSSREDFLSAFASANGSRWSLAVLKPRPVTGQEPVWVDAGQLDEAQNRVRRNGAAGFVVVQRSERDSQGLGQ